MDTAAIFACSHRRGGNSDHAANLLAEGVQKAGGKAEVLYIRNFEVKPCLACGYCEEETTRQGRARCVLGSKDEAHELFHYMLNARTVLFTSPIYFYHLPSMFKTWIDRSQQFWIARHKDETWMTSLPERTAHSILVAGQKKGKKLFSGAELTLKYFVSNFNMKLADPLLLYGVDARDDLQERADLEKQIIEMGQAAWTSAS